MISALTWMIRVAVMGLFAAWLGYCSANPSYRHLDESLATVKLSLHHAGKLLGECRQRTDLELGQLPENMRVPMDCPRERSPLQIELEINGRLVMSESLPARGIHRDGRASVYRRMSVPAGEVQVSVRMKDHVDQENFPYQLTFDSVLQPGANLVIDFDSEAGEFVLLRSESVGDASEQRAALQNALNDLEAGDGQYENDHEVDEAPVRQQFAAVLFDQADDPVRQKIQTDRNDSEQKDFSH